jgi:hypothetical protein
MIRDQLLGTLAALAAKIRAAEAHALMMDRGLTAAREHLIQCEDALLLSGSIDGKNEATRAAQVRAATQVSRERVLQMEESVARARMELRVLGVEFSAAKAMARLLAEPEG